MVKNCVLLVIHIRATQFLIKKYNKIEENMKQISKKAKKELTKSVS